MFGLQFDEMLGLLLLFGQGGHDITQLFLHLLLFSSILLVGVILYDQLFLVLFDLGLGLNLLDLKFLSGGLFLFKLFFEVLWETFINPYSMSVGLEFFTAKKRKKISHLG